MRSLAVRFRPACCAVDDSDDESVVVRKEKRVVRSSLFQKTNTQALNKPSGEQTSGVCLMTLQVQ